MRVLWRSNLFTLNKGCQSMIENPDSPSDSVIAFRLLGKLPSVGSDKDKDRRMHRVLGLSSLARNVSLFRNQFSHLSPNKSGHRVACLN